MPSCIHLVFLPKRLFFRFGMTDAANWPHDNLWSMGPPSLASRWSSLMCQLWTVSWVGGCPCQKHRCELISVWFTHPHSYSENGSLFYTYVFICYLITFFFLHFSPTLIIPPFHSSFLSFILGAQLPWPAKSQCHLQTPTMAPTAPASLIPSVLPSTTRPFILPSCFLSFH